MLAGQVEQLVFCFLRIIFLLFHFQANEFFFFAGLLALVMLIFMFMSYFYKYVYYSVNGEASDEVPLQEAEKGDENNEEETKQ